MFSLNLRGQPRHKKDFYMIKWSYDVSMEFENIVFMNLPQTQLCYYSVACSKKKKKKGGMLCITRNV